MHKRVMESKPARTLRDDFHQQKSGDDEGSETENVAEFRPKKCRVSMEQQ
jgi:hypothetical protein